MANGDWKMVFGDMRKMVWGLGSAQNQENNSWVMKREIFSIVSKWPLLLDRDVKTIGKHIANVLKEEFSGLSVVAKFATTASDGKPTKPNMI